MKDTLDVKSIMNILYDEKDIGRENKGFVCADDVKVVKEGEVIQIPEKEKNERHYQSFTRSKEEKSLALKSKNI